MRVQATLLMVIAATCGSVSGAESLDPADMSGWTVVVAENAIPSENFAAQEFQSLFRQATGVELPLSYNGPSKTQNVFIGLSPAAATVFPELRTDDLGEEGLRIDIRSENIAIVGGAPRGTLYGVYEFMERYLGIRFLTYDHTYAPPSKSRGIPCEAFTYVPPFSFRWSYYKENADHPEFAARRRVNTTTRDEKLGGITHQSLINHTLYRWLPVSEYGETHPEYFALVDGVRNLEMHGGGPEVCSTHPDVIEIVARNVLAELDKDPTQENISVSQNDNDAYCRCDRCEAINKKEGTPMGSHLALVNAVAERVEKKYPDVKIGTLAYWYTRKAPKTMRPRDNIQIQLCSIECCTLHSIDDPSCSRNREFCSDMDEWGRICDDIWVWNYNTNFRMYDLPLPNLRSISRNVLCFHKNNVKGLFMQANGNGNSGELCDLRNYVISSCIWDPKQDSWSLAEEFCRLHYKNASQPILEYLAMLHDNAESSGCHPGCFPTPKEVGLRPEISEKALAYFDRALAMADDDAVRARVEKASISACKAVLETCARLEYADGVYEVGLPERLAGVLDRYVTLCEKHNLTRTAEQQVAADYIRNVQAAAGRKIAASRIENSIWRLTVVPEENGKVVDMIHKPSGRNVLVPLADGALSDMFQIGTIREMGMQGYDDSKPKAFECEATKDAVIMTKTLPGGSVLTRRIGLKSADPESVFFETTIRHSGSEPGTYQFKIIPHFHTVTKSEDSRIVTAYVKAETWMPFNNDWHGNKGPSEEILERATGEYALYNHEEQCGILATYNPKGIARPMLWWDPPLEQANLELITVPATLRDGESFSFEYRFDHLDEPPK